MAKARTSVPTLTLASWPVPDPLRHTAATASWLTSYGYKAHKLKLQAHKATATSYHSLANLARWRALATLCTLNLGTARSGSRPHERHGLRATAHVTLTSRQALATIRHARSRLQIRARLWLQATNDVRLQVTVDNDGKASRHHKLRHTGYRLQARHVKACSSYGLKPTSATGVTGYKAQMSRQGYRLKQATAS